MTRVRPWHFAVALASLAIAACSSEEDPPPNTLSVTPLVSTVDAGGTVQLVAELRSPEGTPVTGASFTWTSSADSIATVTGTGLVTGLADGSARITVTSDGRTAEAGITIESAPAQITAAPGPVILRTGIGGQLVVTVYNQLGAVMVNAPVTYAISPAIATVNAFGTITPTGAGGNAIVTATAGTVHTDIPVVITGHPLGVLGRQLPLSLRPFGIALHRDSMLIVTRLDAASIARARTDEDAFRISIPVGMVPTSVVTDPSGDTAYVANQFSDNVGLVHLESGVQFATIPVSGDPFRVLKGPFDLVYVTTNADSVFALNTSNGTFAARVGVGADPNGIALSTDIKTLYVTNMSSGTLSVVDHPSFEVVRTIVLGGTPQEVVISPDGTELYVANESSFLQIVNIATGNVTNGGPGTENLFGLALSPDGMVLVGSRPGTGQVVVIDRASRQVMSTVETGGTPRRIAMDLLGSIAAVANESGWVDLIR